MSNPDSTLNESLLQRQEPRVIYHDSWISANHEDLFLNGAPMFICFGTVAINLTFAAMALQESFKFSKKCACILGAVIIVVNSGMCARLQDIWNR